MDLIVLRLYPFYGIGLILLLMESILLSNNLIDIESAVWTKLAEGTRSAKSPFHQAAIANVQVGFADVRMVVVRNVLCDEKKIFFHTDRRSPKFQALQENPTLSWLFYSLEDRLQVRINAYAILHHQNEISEQVWKTCRTSSKLTYAYPQGPGTKIDTPSPFDLNQKDPPEEMLLFAQNNFSVVETSAVLLDVLFLHHAGNRRAIFDYEHKERYWVQV